MHVLKLLHDVSKGDNGLSWGIRGEDEEDQEEGDVGSTGAASKDSSYGRFVAS